MSARLTRRRVLAALAALPAWPALAQLPTNPDVVIVGAGMAGLAAAKWLIGKEASVVLLEARKRTGGRVLTDTHAFGIPVDLGAAWLHSADANPVTPLVRALGFRTVPDDEDPRLYLDGKEASEPQYQGFFDAYERLVNAVDEAADEEDDMAVTRAAPPKTHSDRLAHARFGALEAGMETGRLSVKDVAVQQRTGVEWMLPDGFGTFVNAYAKGLPVKLDARVERVRLTREGVIVDSTAGTIAAKAVIVTVSAALLAEGAIQFDPPLPDWKRESFERLPMGLVDKIALQFKDNAFGDLEFTTCYVKNGSGPVLASLVRPFGDELAVCFVGGTLARDLEKAGDAAAIDLALNNLRSVFGHAIRKEFKKGVFTRWGSDPFAKGSYAFAQVGHHDKRALLAKPVGRLFFAGEACASEWPTHVAGAFLSGVEAAKAAIKEIR
ncbi:MAG: FAD-binding protein [Rhodospirillales bacterium]|nr:FAD-binding protein [Rhodospirillales bacterium]